MAKIKKKLIILKDTIFHYNICFLALLFIITSSIALYHRET